MRVLPLSQGLCALVDDDDFERLSAHKWHAIKKRNTYYARRSIHPGPPHGIYMHQEIMPSFPGLVTDHADGDGLNNQKSNLRRCTCSQNECNGPYRGGRSGFKGVFPSRTATRWFGRIRVAGKIHYLGCFRAPEDAARAYDKAAIRLHGEFARLNFPNEVAR